MNIPLLAALAIILPLPDGPHNQPVQPTVAYWITTPVYQAGPHDWQHRVHGASWQCLIPVHGGWRCRIIRTGVR